MPDGAAALLDGPMAAALEDQRDRCNALVAQARRARSGFSTDRLAAVLRGPVAELVEACERVAPGRGGPVLHATFPAVVELVGQRRLDAGPHVALLAALPALAGPIVDDPRRLVAALGNAVIHLQGHGCDADAWIARVAAAGAGADAATTLVAGQVAAWAVGLAHARAGALAVAGDLAPPVLAAALGVDDLPGDALDRLRADRWWRPTGPVAAGTVVHRVGGFRGFGGPFLAAPLVAPVDGRIVVASGPARWHLHADAFGATLTRLGADGPSVPTVAGRGRVTSEAATADTVARTDAASYAVAVLRGDGR